MLDQPILRDIIADDSKLAAFLQETPLAACDDDRRILAAILPCDPNTFTKPLPGTDAARVLTVSQNGSSTHFRIPAAVTYLALRVNSSTPIATFEIETPDGTVRTNMQELSRKLPYSLTTEEEREAAFSTLDGTIERPKPRKKPRAFQSKILGKVQPDDDGDLWYAEPLSLAFFDGRALPVMLREIDGTEKKAIDIALQNLLAMTPEDRLAGSAAVLKNCHDYLEAIGAQLPEDLAMAAITDATEIWRHVSNEAIEIVRDGSAGEPSIYVAFTCECAWEPEHGLQLVYRNGNELTRVSAQDGWVTEN